MKKYPPETEYYPLGLRPETVLGMSTILENMINQHLVEFPRQIVKKPASINTGALTFKIYIRKRKKK